MNRKLNITDIFSPRTFPQNTYITRQLDQDETIDETLKRALDMKGNLIFVTGTSKSGKTVLCHRVIPQEKYIALNGNMITSIHKFWQQIAEKLPLSDSIIKSSTKQTDNSKTNKNKIGIDLKIFTAEKENGSDKTDSISNQITTTNHLTESQIIRYLIENDKVLVIDDFHYINSEVQRFIAQTIKVELFNGLKAIIISLPHRSDEAIVQNTDLIGRTSLIEIPPWTKEELKKIAEIGFSLLDIKIPEEELELLATESITSPQLMQDNCLQLAISLVEKGKILSRELIFSTFNKTAKAYILYENIVKAVLKGPSKGSGRRKQYEIGKSKMDIYQLMLEALKADPPVIKLPMEELQKRTGKLLNSPKGLTPSVITQSIKKIVKIVNDFNKELEILDYRGQCLYILDPFFIFYLRWTQTTNSQY